MVLLDLPVQIETGRLLLQRLRYEDAEEIFYTYASKPEATTYVSWPTHQSLQDSRTYVKYAVDAWTMGLDFTFTIRLKESARMIGTFGVINDDGKIQFGYILSPSMWGQGYATEACRAIIDILKTQRTLHKIWTFVDAENIASIRVLQKSGLVEEARLAKWFRFINQGNEPKDCIIFKLP